MDTKAFDEHVAILFKPGQDQLADLMHAAGKLASEAGELIDPIWAHKVYNKPLDVTNIIEEVGDALFYLSAVMAAINYNLADAMAANVNKLKKRYPNGYSDDAALARADKQESA